MGCEPKLRLCWNRYKAFPPALLGRHCQPEERVGFRIRVASREMRVENRLGRIRFASRACTIQKYRGVFR
jgi:hypothetical protein